MIAHVVLFRPRAALRDAQREEFLTALERAVATIPDVTRARVGRRLTLGRLYDQQNAQDFPYVAILEFEDEAGLRAYLAHPAHRALGEQFYLTSESALVFDFDLVGVDRARALLA